MIIDVFAICWNEERLLPLFLNHYSRFARRIVVYDNHSTDRSPDLIAACPLADLRTYDSGGLASEDAFLKVKNRCWKDSDADRVIVCDIDELVWHPRIKQYLSLQKPNRVLRTRGFDIVGPLTRQVPAELHVWRRCPNALYSKPAVFDPRVRPNVTFRYGCHHLIRNHRVVQSRLLMLHVPWLGSTEELIARWQARARRQHPADIANRRAVQWQQTPEQITAHHRRLHAEAEPFTPVVLKRLVG